MKLAMYSHDTFGLGHIRRTLLIAEHLSSALTDLSVLIVSGSSMIHEMRIPRNVDYVKIPCLTKVTNGCYQPKFLGRAPSEVKTLRREIILNALKGYRPDIFVADKVPTGIDHELIASLRYLREEQNETKVILGMRDILDSPDHVRAEWEETGAYEALQEYYDEIWVYGSQRIMDVVEVYGFPREVEEMIHYCGYLRRNGSSAEPDKIRRELGLGDRKLVLMTLGGGGDGHEIVPVFHQAMSELSHSGDPAAMIVTGPDFPADRLKSVLPDGERNGSFIYRDYMPNLIDYMAASDVVVAMSGYNTICEVLSLNKAAITIPRITPRTEQLIRAEKFSGMGLLKMIHPLELSPGRLAAEIIDSLDNPRRSPHPFGLVDFRGLDSITDRVEALCNDRGSTGCAASPSPCSSEWKLERPVEDCL